MEIGQGAALEALRHTESGLAGQQRLSNTAQDNATGSQMRCGGQSQPEMSRPPTSINLGEPCCSVAVSAKASRVDCPSLEGEEEVE